jgi:type I restriction enzyme M protein
MSRRARELESYVWDIADILRGKFEQPEYGKIILPLTVMRRLDCALAPVKAAVLAAHANMPHGLDDGMRRRRMRQAAGGLHFWNTHPLDFEGVSRQEPDQLLDTLKEWMASFSPEVRDVLLNRFGLLPLLQKMEDKRVLWSVVTRVSGIDLRPKDASGSDLLTNTEMGHLFERLIRRFAEMSNKTAGEHYTPREVIDLMVDLLFVEDRDALTGEGVVRDIYDPACGTGGMLTTAEERIRRYNRGAIVRLYGQENADDSYGVCVGDMLVKGHDPASISPGNTLSEDQHVHLRPHYMLSNPPYGMKWNDIHDVLSAEAGSLDGGRFSAGLPRKSDGQLLFLQHMVSKMRDDAAGSRIGVVMSASPLFAGGAGEGESQIRRWLLENDWVEAIVGLPTQMFYNTGIQTFLWLLSNRKRPERRGMVQLIDASGPEFWRPMRRSLGDKRRELTEEGIRSIVAAFGSMGEAAADATWCKILPASSFGYRRVTVRRPLRLAFDLTPEGREKLPERAAWEEANEATRTMAERLLPHLPQARRMNRADFLLDLAAAAAAEGIRITAAQRKALVALLAERDEEAVICLDAAGRPEPDPGLRDYENVPFGTSWEDVLEREVHPWFPDAWVDEEVRDRSDDQVGIIGYEIPFNRHFYKPPEQRAIEEIDGELRALLPRLSGDLRELLA